ncbi:2-hydroxycarboxylate transporter family protein [Aerococcus urinaeequi]|uniref:2-hydroxycarboxylate transporter family protein n=1 Tax=Aerococcus urinaeequi TaxID=51665 RepID=A0AAE9XJS5_9LACT|nr:2-hydroxycarboxylate transporter family protein [Aerococcus urinaeequi]WCG38126.1 2-hydroxycarboxylate transporter family protein [Aerococcus urinaeequi]
MSDLARDERSTVSAWQGVKVGPMPLPWFLLFAAIILMAAVTESLPVDMLGGFGVILTLGWALGKIGDTIPGLNKFGGSTILSMLVPAILVFYGLLPDNAIESVTMLMSDANFLDLYVFSLVTGSILGMNRQVLVQGFARMVIPMSVGLVLAMLIPAAIGQLVGIGFQETLFNIVTPAMAGGIGGGVLPLAQGYSEVQNIDYGAMVAILAPASILSNFFSIGVAAIVGRFGEKHPELSGNGTLVRQSATEEKELVNKEKKTPINFQSIGIGLFLLVAVYIFGNLMQGIIGLPAAVIVIFASTIMKYFQVLPASIEEGAKQLNGFISSNFTAPLMVGLGIIYLDLKAVLDVLTWQYVVVVLAVVIVLGLTGFILGKFLNMYQIESAILSLNQSAMGGTGNVAILATTDRNSLMPFAQVATRIGGAITISIMITLLNLFA